MGIKHIEHQKNMHPQIHQTRTQNMENSQFESLKHEAFEKNQNINEKIKISKYIET